MTDQRMPQMTGVELLQRAQEECPEAVRIIFTGYADIKAVIDAINQGQIYRYLTKPWDPDELVAVLRQACGRVRPADRAAAAAARPPGPPERCGDGPRTRGCPGTARPCGRIDRAIWRRRGTRAA